MSKKINWSRAGEVMRQLVLPVKSPIFLTMLVLAFLMWYALKLSYVYTTEVSVPVRIDGERYRVKCMVEARGTEIWAQRLAIGGRINIPLSDLAPHREGDNPYYTITNSAMSNAIMQRTGSLRVIDILEIPEIAIHSEE